MGMGDTQLGYLLRTLINKKMNKTGLNLLESPWDYESDLAEPKVVAAVNLEL